MSSSLGEGKGGAEVELAVKTGAGSQLEFLILFEARTFFWDRYTRLRPATLNSFDDGPAFWPTLHVLILILDSRRVVARRAPPRASPAERYS